MKKRSTKLNLEEISEFFERIITYTKGMDYNAFTNNQMVIDAVLRNLEIVGEATKNIPDNIKERFPNIPWSEMVGLRNIAAHGYFKIDLSIIWDIIIKDIPDTKEKIIEIYKELFKINKLKN